MVCIAFCLVLNNIIIIMDYVCYILIAKYVLLLVEIDPKWRKHLNKDGNNNENRRVFLYVYFSKLQTSQLVRTQ